MKAARLTGIVTGALMAALAFGAGAARADVMGLWQVPGGSITLRLAPCGSSICGFLMDSNRLRADPDARDEKNKDPALRSRLLRGLQMLQGLRGGPSNWSGGRLYLPGNGQTYPASMKLDGPDALSLKVCLTGPLCRTQALRRVK